MTMSDMGLQQASSLLLVDLRKHIRVIQRVADGR